MTESSLLRRGLVLTASFFLLAGAAAMSCWHGLLGALGEQLEKVLFVALLMLPGCLFYGWTPKWIADAPGHIPVLMPWGVVLVYFVPGGLLLAGALCTSRRAGKPAGQPGRHEGDEP